ncbi:MAG: peptide chain release factor 2 [Holophagales bacterium]|nr:MAG: peptide chain release factor 2 [Holophagales bacterium]
MLAIDLQNQLQDLGEKLAVIRGYFEDVGLEENLRDIDRQIEQPGFWDRPADSAQVLQKRRAIERRLETLKKLRDDASELATWLELLAEPGAEVDPDAVAFAERLTPQLAKLDLDIKLSGPDDEKPALVAINSGAGGTESQDWAEMLLRLYVRWAERKGYELELLDRQDGEEAGIKNATIAVRGEHAFGFLKGENGVHRLVRISPFDSAARRHTSFASVYVYPEVDDTIEIEILDKDLKIDVYRASGAGGQHVNRTESAVRMTHLPTGIVVTCQNERSQIKNRASAMKVMRARLYDLEMKKRKEESDKREGEKMDIAWGSQIRSYVLQPYRMVKDHRTGLSIGDTDAVLDGAIDPFIEAFLKGQIATPGDGDDVPV